MFSRIKAAWLMIEFVITVLITIVLMYIFRTNTRPIRRFWAKMQSCIMGYKLHIKGEVDPKADLLLLNHQSLVDIIIFEQIHPKDLCWVAKKELQNIPLFGHIINAPRMIAIDRKDKRSIVKIIKISKKRLAEGRTIAMFPEGTRSDGTKLLKFQSGAKILAEKLSLKVQPALIVGSRTIFDSKTLKAKCGDVKIIYLDTIDSSSDPLWFEKMKSDMEKCLHDELADTTSHR